MGTIALILRLALAAIFTVAAIAKLVDLPGARKGVLDFGIPGWAVGSVALLLPLAELSLAALLLPVSTAAAAGLGALVLLTAFIAGIGVNLTLGRKPSCNCFGQLHAEPIGWSTLVRNGVLAGGAGFVLWQAETGAVASVVDWTAGLSAAEIAGIVLGSSALVLVAAQSWLTFHLLRQNGRLLLRMDALEAPLVRHGPLVQPASPPAGLPVGSPAPGFKLPRLDGGSAITLDALRAERRPVVLIFSDPDCGPCTALLPEIARWEQDYARTLTFSVVSRGSPETNRRKIGKLQLSSVLLQSDREITTPLAMGPQAIAGLVAMAGSPQPAAFAAVARSGSGQGMAAVPSGLPIGHAAPALELPNLDGTLVSLSSSRGTETLVLFWNPSCGFCARMLPDLRKWEEERDAGMPQLLVVSAGTAEANRAMGLRAPVLLDQSFATGRAFQVQGTPAAVLVDAGGKIGSAVASGAAAVLALARPQQRLIA